MPLLRCKQSHGIKPGHENDFRDSNSGQTSPGQRAAKCRLFFGSGRGGTHVCSKTFKLCRSRGKNSRCPSFIVRVAKHVKREVEKSSLDEPKVVERFVGLAEAVEEKRAQIKLRIPTKRSDLFDPLPHQQTYPTATERIQRLTVQKRVRKSRNSAVVRPIVKIGGAGTIVLTVITAPSHL